MMREGRFADAIALSDAVLQAEPERPRESLHPSGSPSKQREPSGKALTAFQDLLAKTPGSLPVQLRIASLYLVRGDTKAALGFLSTVLKAQPQLGNAHFLLGQALLQAGDLPAPSASSRVSEPGPCRNRPKRNLAGLLYQVKGDAANARASFRVRSNGPRSRKSCSRASSVRT